MPKQFNSKTMPKHLKPIDMSDLLEAYSHTLPEEVPVLEARDMHQGGFHSYRGDRHCLAGHSMCVSKPGQYACNAALNTAMQRHIQALGPKGPHGSVVHFNDYLSTKGAAARVWNAAMRDLGYTEGNPEA